MESLSAFMQARLRLLFIFLLAGMLFLPQLSFAQDMTSPKLMPQNMNSYCMPPCCANMKERLKHKRHSKKMAKYSPTVKFIKTIYSLDLTDKQKETISILKSEMKLEMRKSSSKVDNMENFKSFFTKDGFDTNNFSILSNENAKKAIAIKANYIEKIYATLTDKQKEEFIKDINKSDDKKRDLL